jgi:hypothetical protein
MAKKRDPLNDSIKEFSGFVSEAIKRYAEEKYPGLTKEVLLGIDATPAIVTSHRWFRAENPTGKKLRRRVKGVGAEGESALIAQMGTRRKDARQKPPQSAP